MRLRAPAASDLPDLERWRGDPDAQLMLMTHVTATDRREVEAWIARRTRDPEGDFRVVTSRKNDRAVGFVQLSRINSRDGHAHLGLFVDPSVRGTGTAAGALAAMEREAFHRHGLKKLLLEVLAINARALRFWEVHDYRRVGVLEEHYRRDDRLYDVVIFEKRLVP